MSSWKLCQWWTMICEAAQALFQSIYTFKKSITTDTLIWLYTFWRGSFLFIWLYLFTWPHQSLALWEIMLCSPSLCHLWFWHFSQIPQSHVTGYYLSWKVPLYFSSDRSNSILLFSFDNVFNLPSSFIVTFLKLGDQVFHAIFKAQINHGFAVAQCSFPFFFFFFLLYWFVDI